jgi:hypothetical protein
MYDCLRANKSTSAWGIEARVPFLDKEFMNVAMAIDPKVGPFQKVQEVSGQSVNQCGRSVGFGVPELPFSCTQR